MDGFMELVNFLAPRIARHPSFNDGFDYNIANWLDLTEEIYRIYSRWKYSPFSGQGKSAELQSRHLLELWKQHVGRSKATFGEFKKAIRGKELTGQLIEDIDNRMEALPPVNGDIGRFVQSGMCIQFVVLTFFDKSKEVEVK